MSSQPPVKPPETPTRRIPLVGGLFALIDEADYELISQYEWHAEIFKCSFYANAHIKVRGHKKTLRMHRMIAKTPPRKVTHHLNHNSLDNRRCNLINFTPSEHMMFHSNNSIRIKFAQPPVDKSRQNSPYS